MKNPFAVALGIVVAGLVALGMVSLGGCSPDTTPQPGTAKPPSLSAGPELVLGEEQYEFGTMETDGDGRHEFLLANGGDRPLTLGRAKTSCGCCTCACDAYLPEQGTIPPGGSAKVTLAWKINRYTGGYRQSETLTTNDPGRPEVTLAVTGRITPTVRVVPTQLVFTRVAAGEPALGEVRLYGYRAEPLRIVGHELSDRSRAGDFELTWEPLPADQVAEEEDARSGCLLRVKVSPKLAAGPFRQQVVLRTNVDSAATIELPVQGTVGSELSVTGFGWEEETGVFTLGTVAAAKGTRRKLQVVVRGPHAKEVKLEPREVVPELLEVEVGEGRQLGSGEVMQIPLTIRVPPGSPAVNHSGSKAEELARIVLATGHPRQPELRILVRFRVKVDPAG